MGSGRERMTGVRGRGAGCDGHAGRRPKPNWCRGGRGWQGAPAVVRAPSHVFLKHPQSDTVVIRISSHNPHALGIVWVFTRTADSLFQFRDEPEIVVTSCLGNEIVL